MSVLEAGQTFERYRIIQWLGSGISGESYEAEDTMLLRKVTLKLIHPWSILPEASRRQFFREMQGISVLNSPYLASVLDYGEIDGRLYVARRYVTSGSLLGNDGRAWFRPPLNITDAIRYGHQIAQALEHIHQHTCLHGGLTFSNILVLRGPNLDNEPNHAPFLLADVGLANFVRRFGEPSITLLPVTAAPEQLGQRVTPASDQFALAVLLYFWLTGRPPYLGTPEEIAQLKLTATIIPPSTLNSLVTTEQAGIVLRALSVYPEERYSSTLLFVQALLATLATSPTALSDTTAKLPTITRPAEPAPFAASLPDTEPDALLSAEQEAGNHTEWVSPQLLSTSISQLSSEEATPISQALPSLAPESSSPSSPRLIVVSPYAEEPYEILLEGEETTLGRAGSSDILLDKDNLTSRHHALLRHERNTYVLYDRSSANGVFVNGQKLAAEVGYMLEDGDHISVGNYELIFRSGVQGKADEDENAVLIPTDNAAPAARLSPQSV